MSGPDPTVESLLRGAGFSSSGIDRIKLGNGVVGKMTSTQMGLYVVCFAGVCGGVYLNIPYMMVAFGGVALLSFLFSSIAGMWFAAKYPSVALLEGAELVKYHQIEMATRDLINPPDQPNIEAPLLGIEGGAQ